MRPLFQLSARLETCAQMVRPCERMADIGTDHALLPIWLIKTGRVQNAVAADVRTGPLAATRENALKYRVADQLETRLSDGLKAFQADETNEIVIAGMGGELIRRIIADAQWLQAPGKHLVLQPMSMAPALRKGLYEMDFCIRQEQALVDGTKVYSVMSVEYARQTALSPLAQYMGKIKPGEGAASVYAKKICRMLDNEIAGYKALRLSPKTDELNKIIQEIRTIYLEI